MVLRQDHYDFGMRTVKAVLNMAGLRKRSHPTEPEASILMRALQDCNVPKMVADDIPLYK